jgi:hypothetical protein
MFYSGLNGMDWGKAVERHRDALLGVLATLLSLLGLDQGEGRKWISRAMHRAAFRTLTPAEAAVRRLIAVLARDVAVKPRQGRPMPAGLKISRKDGGRVSFRLCDPPERIHLKPFRPINRAIPRIRFVTADPRITAFQAEPQREAAPLPETQVDATRLYRRLAALQSALEDLPRQAKRLARLRAKRERSPDMPAPIVMRRGSPPGHRKVALYDVDRTLHEVHELACHALLPDTS